jgi:hypothetical protein
MQGSTASVFVLPRADGIERMLCVTGSICVEGGKKVKTAARESREDSVAIVQERRVSAARRAADSLVATYSKRLRKLRIATTPFGVLVPPEKQKELRTLMFDISRAAMEFNKQGEDTRVWNCYVVEELQASKTRLSAILGWLDRKVREGDAQALRVLGLH